MDTQSLEGANRSEDMICRLPDDVLCRILSCLPTEVAVQTTLLSSRWNHLWTSIYNLHFDDWPICSRNENSRACFLNFVDRVLALCQSKSIHDFQLTSIFLRDEDLSRVSEWICFAVQHNVHRLILSVQIRSNQDRVITLLPLPPSIITCKTLVELRLCNGVILDIPDSVVCFPSLRILHVRVEHLNSNAMKMFFGCCPQLEDLTVNGSLYLSDNVQNFNIVVLNLKTLNIHVYILSRSVSEHKFVITTPNLEHLSITVNSLAYFIVNELPFLKRAFVSVGCYVLRKSSGITKNEVNRAMELLRGINQTKTLTLTRNTMTALSFVYDDSLPTFANLTSLKLDIDSSFRWKLLIPLLNNSPNLEVLILDLWKAHKLYSRLLEEIISEDAEWVEPEHVPCCLLLRVKVIKIIRMQRKDQQLKVVKYLLENSEVLEKLSVGFFDSAEEEYLRKELIMSPKGSKTFEIEFL